MNAKIFKAIGIALLYCGLFRLSFGFGGFIKNVFPDEFYWFALGGFGILSIFLITWVFLRLEKRSFGDIGIFWEAKTLKRFVLGFALGLAIISIMILAITTLTGLKIEFADNYNFPSFLFWSMAFLPLAFMEEVAFRSYPLLKLKSVVGVRLALIITAVLFAAYHLPGQSTISALMGPGVWAFAYGMAALISKGIAVPTGLHFGANFVLASIGDKSGVDPIWVVNYAQEVTSEMTANTANVSTLVSVIFLLGGLFLMEWYIRKNQSAKNSK